MASLALAVDCAAALRLLLLAACLATATWAQQQCAERGLDLGHPAVRLYNPPGDPANFFQRCIEYRRVCFDQGTVVSFDPAHSPANASHVALPQLDITRLLYVWGGRQNVLDDLLPNARATFAPLAFRPAGAFEGAPDLQRPVFSNCTVPMVMWFAHSAHNYAEFVLRALPRVHALQRDGALSNRSTLVVGGPAGERLPPYVAAVLGPFTPYDVVSFSDFSQRNAPADGPRTTAEGWPRPRCFERAYLCAFQAGFAPGLTDGAQALVGHYRTRAPSANPLGFDAGPEVLRVLIDHRTGPVRNLLNAEQLVDACNRQSAAWLSPEWQRSAASPIRRMQCRLYSFGNNTAADIVAAASADVLVAVHGAGCANWLYMRPGSALLELRPFEFGSRGWPDLYFPVAAAHLQWSLHWYGLNVEDPSLSRPGALEAANPRRAWGRGQEMALMRDRHTELPLPALREMLVRIAAAARMRQRYLAQLRLGTFNVALLPGGVLQPVKVRTAADAQRAAQAPAAAASPGQAAAGPAAATGPGPSQAAAEEPASAAAAASQAASPAVTLLSALAMLAAVAALRRTWGQPQKGRAPHARPAGALALLLACGVVAAQAQQAQQQCAERGLDLGHPAVRPWARPQLGKAWGQACVEYRRVCFDQDTVVSFDPAHSPANASSTPLPRLDVSALTYTWAGRDGVNGDVYRGAGFKHSTPEVRPASMYEGAPDLQQPVFSNCTVPLVMWGLWSSHNYLEFFARVAARVYALQRDGALSRAATLVLGQPAGERPPGFGPAVLRALTPYDVTSFSTFSQRNTPADGPRSTAEGWPHQRCFERAYLCAFQVPYGHGIAPLGQTVAAYYKARLPANPLGFDPGPEVLRVIIESRKGPARNLLNAAELAAACSSESAGWQYDAASPVRRVQCRAYTFGNDTAADVVAAASADVIVAVHGAGCTNWLYMAPGSALLELRPYQFGSKGWADGYFPLVGHTANHSLHWWGLNIEDPTAHRPSAIEAADPARGRTDTRMMRDRHTALPLPALREMLVRIAAVARSRERYLAQRGAGRHYAELLPGGALQSRCSSKPNAACSMAPGAPEPLYVPEEQRRAAAQAAAAAAADQQARSAAAPAPASQQPVVAAAQAAPVGEAAAAPGAAAASPATATAVHTLPVQPWLFALGQWSRTAFREQPPLAAVLGAAALLLAAVAVGRSLHGSAKQRPPPHGISFESSPEGETNSKSPPTSSSHTHV